MGSTLHALLILPCDKVNLSEADFEFQASDLDPPAASFSGRSTFDADDDTDADVDADVQV